MLAQKIALTVIGLAVIVGLESILDQKKKSASRENVGPV